MRWLLFFFLQVSSIASFANCKAILINGGANPQNNFYIHGAQLREMYNALRAKGCKEEDIFVFSASGSSTSPDFRVDPTSENSSFVANPYNFNGKTRVLNLYPADADTLKSKISQISGQLKSDEQLFVYVADHGGNNDGKKGLVPWFPPGNPQTLFTPEDMEKALSAAPASAKVKLWTECCYCGVFNKIKRPNTCVATSTDEYHVGSYNWTDWDKYAKNQIRPAQMTSKTYFAGQMKNEAGTSLTNAAKVSRNLTSQDARIQAETLQNGCFIGPRDSLDQYIFATMGFGSRQMCVSDVLKLTAGHGKVSSYNCGSTSPMAEIEKLQTAIEAVQSQQGALNYTEKMKIRELAGSLKNMGIDLVSSPEYQRIQSLQREFHKLSPQLQISEARRMQEEVAKLKIKMLNSTHYFDVLASNEKLIMEALFFSQATPEQKDEYRRRKKCLDEPLF